MERKLKKKQQNKGRWGDISISKHSYSGEYNQTSLAKLEHNKKRYKQNLSKLVKLVGHYPIESVAAIRNWID